MRGTCAADVSKDALRTDIMWKASSLCDIAMFVLNEFTHDEASTDKAINELWRSPFAYHQLFVVGDASARSKLGTVRATTRKLCKMLGSFLEGNLDSVLNEIDGNMEKATGREQFC